MNLKFEAAKNVIKVAKEPTDFADPKDLISVEDFVGDTLFENILMLLKLGEAKVTINIPNQKYYNNLMKIFTGEVSIEETPTSKPRDLTNVTTASFDNTKKYSATNIPGNFVLLRDNNTGLIYIGNRKHTYSYYNVCCISNDIAFDFMKDVKNTIASKINKTKDGRQKLSVDKNDPVIYNKWNTYMNDAYTIGARLY